MSHEFAIRRIITGHDAQGRAVVVEDDRLPASARFVEHAAGDKHIYSADLWGTTQRPVDNSDAALPMQRAGGRELPAAAKGQRSAFRIVDLPPGSVSPMHRTETVDYAILLEGTCDLLLDSGEAVSCRAGDVVIQRGTMHSWINRSDAACRWCWILIDADPVTAGGTSLGHEWNPAPSLD